ncbi:sigma-54-dependent Fis family transcriptional regulator [Burkholderia pyrrocinia]|uniref:Sigma-54-dependent Fis family transcriptional regulator n=1 Tax=Burkholderia pyrrocinia TaxID=60550 RepID=A0A2Z5N5G5_BURPY|nr:sigma-54 dependent transcriptional regulator [Burkholderia pyrrocinia]AXF23947.1 sigma-54-dependent Fis family transcriptional regulator [Burkholderia pyrrocinia]
MNPIRNRAASGPDACACDTGTPEAHPLIGVSSAFRQLVGMIDRLAPTEHTLLIVGPTGSGKELVARRLHANGPRRDMPFIDVNCGAIPHDLIEAEFFGHMRGAFTGAVEHHRGLFEQVGSGTLFLDEIGELPLALQPKLLRVLETRAFRPIGASANLRFHGRVVAATHRNLLEEAHAGRFREDLFYRLAVFILNVPGLAQRSEDIPLLAAHFAAQQARAIAFTPAAIKRLCEQPWPGNVRQLRNLVSQLSVFVQHARIDAETLAPFLATEAHDAAARAHLADRLLELGGDDKLAAAERLLIDRALERASYNKSAAAALLGVGRKVIERRLKARETQHGEARQCLERAEALVGTVEFREAVALLRRCLDLLQKTSPTEDSRRLQFGAYRLLAVNLRSIHGWQFPEAMACYKAALSIGDGVCDACELAAVQFGIWTTQLVTLQLSKARATAQELLQRAHAMGDRAALDEAHVALANTLFWLGDSEEALASLSRGGLRSIGRADRRLGAQGVDVAGLALTLEGLAAYQTGAVDDARRAMDSLIARTEEEHPQSPGRAADLQGAAWLAMLFNDTDRLRDLTSALDAASSAGGPACCSGAARIFRACYLSAVGKHGEAEAMLLDGYDNDIAKHGGALFYSIKTWKHGELLLSTGRARQCEALVSEALDEVIRRQERAYLGELLIVKARAQWMLGDTGAAEQGLRIAISTALALGSVPARLAATAYLADLLRQSTRTTSAVEALERPLHVSAAALPAPGLIQAPGLL